MKALLLLPLCSAVASLLLVQPAVGTLCPRQGNSPIEICAMCSESNAAVRWNVSESEIDLFEFANLRYTCTAENGTTWEDTSDTCFERSSSIDVTGLTGVAAIGHRLETGVQCQFRLAYKLVSKAPIVKSVDCTIQSPEVCAANPENCQVDKISEMVENGDCLEYHCADGYIGEDCNNLNECESNSTNTCHEDAECHDTEGSYWCECGSGFTGDGYNCTDINECETDNSTCHENAVCSNNEGNFSCQCATGFTGDGYSNCSDINECLLDGVCHEMAVCNNTVGSFECECRVGYDGDGQNCSDIDECGVGNNQCHEDAHCTNIEGSYVCACLPGFQGDGYNCTDKNECELESLCDQDAECTNTVGSYHCDCNTGYTGDGYNCSASDCENDDKCRWSNTRCVADELKTGILRCTCLSGFSGEADQCKDIDECSEETYNCHDNATCRNTPGSYRCDCLEGFVGDGSIDCVAIKNKDSSVNVVAIWSGVTVCAVLILLVILSVITAHLCTKYFKSEFRLPFEELTKMDLDPYYSPAFWKGSLTSVHSEYEQLQFSNLLTDVTQMENCKQHGIRQDQVSINIAVKESGFIMTPHTAASSTAGANNTADLSTQSHTSDYRNPEDTVNGAKKPEQPSTNAISTATDANGSLDLDAISISDVLAILEDDTAPESTPHRNNTISETRALPLGAMTSPMTSPSLASGISSTRQSTGYVQECKTGDSNLSQNTGSGSVSIAMENFQKLHKSMPSEQKAVNIGYVNESDMHRHVSFTLEQKSPAGIQQTIKQADITASSGHVTEAVVDKRHMPPSTSATDQDPERGNEQKTDLACVVSHATCSNGYVSESMTSGLLGIETDAHTRQATCSRDSFEQENQLGNTHNFQYRTKSVSSSGYTSESAAEESGIFSRQVSRSSHGTAEQGYRHTKHQLSTHVQIGGECTSDPLSSPSESLPYSTGTYSRKTSCSSCSLQEELELGKQHSSHYIANSVGSSGYNTESAACESENCHSPASSKDLTDRKVYVDHDSVKFTVNGNQEFEYVNCIENHLTAVNFDIAS